MKRDRIIVGILIVLLLLFTMRGCSFMKQNGEKQTVTQTEDSKKEESKQEGNTVQKETDEAAAEIVLEGETESKEESVPGTKQNVTFEGMEILGYTTELERVLENDAGKAAKSLRSWLDKNGYSGVTGVAFCDTISIVQSEQKYSVECQLIVEDGNGIQPENGKKATVLVMDYYKNRGMYQFHP